MTRRLCLIGNSHVVAFANGWKAAAERHPDVSITFFAAPGAKMADLQPRDGALVASDPLVRQTLGWVSGGRRKIVAARYDEFWLIGLRFGVETILPAYAAAWAESHAPDPSRAPVSEAAFGAAATALLRASPAVALHERLRSLTAAPIRLFPQPNPSIVALAADDARTAPFRLAARQGDEDTLWRQYLRARERLVADASLDVCDQPDDTRERAIFTTAALSQGSVRLTQGLDRKHEVGEAIHMNASYGTLMLDRFLPEPPASNAEGTHDDARTPLQNGGWS